MSIKDGPSQGDWSVFAEKVVAERDEARAKLVEAKDALRAMFAACDEWAAEFTQHKRAMNWGVVNDAYCKASKVLKEE